MFKHVNVGAIQGGCIIVIPFKERERGRERIDRIKAPGANYKGDDQVARKLDGATS